MTAASRYTYLGAAIFAGAAVVASLVVLLPFFPPHLDYPLGATVQKLASMSIAAGISAALSFALLNGLGWQPRRNSLMLRATLLGTLVVAGAHLLIGVMIALMALIAAAISPQFEFSRDVVTVSIVTAVFGVYYGLYITVPLGVAAAILFEWLEQRLTLARGNRAEVVE